MSANAIITALEQQGYVQTAKFSFLELLYAVRAGFATRNRLITAFWAAQAVAALLLAGVCWWYVAAGHGSLARCLLYASAGVWGALLLLVPVHELLHGLAFRRYGARDIRYGMILKYLMFYAAPHLFVMSYRQYRYVAMVPFVVISIGCLLAMLLLPPVYKVLAASTLCFHTLCCAGDFGLSAYMHTYRDRDIVTFDDVEANTVWFFCKSS